MNIISVSSHLYQIKDYVVETVASLFSAPNVLKLPTARFSHCKELTSSNLYKVWKSGDYTVRGVQDQTLLITRHRSFVQCQRGEGGIHKMVRMHAQDPAHLTFNQAEWTSLRHNWSAYRLDDLLRPIKEVDGSITFQHLYSGQTLTATITFEKTTRQLIGQ